MTFRRVMLVLLPLLGALLVFMALRWVYTEWEASFIHERLAIPQGPREMPAGVEEVAVREGITHGVSTNVNLARKDKQGRLEMRFLSPRIVHKAKDTVDIDQPQIQFFTKGNEIITLMADQATAVTTGPLMSIADIRSGRLWGNVVLIHDRGTPDDFADDILVGLVDLTFDNDTYEMATDGPVVLTGAGMSLTARKMRLALDRDTRRINTMTFLEHIFISMEMRGRLQSFMSPEPEAPGPAPAAPAAPASPTPGPAAASAEADTGELWRIDLAGDVDARQDMQGIRCRQLSLYNTARQSDQGASPGPSAVEVPGAAAPRETPAGAPATPADAPEAPPPLLVIADGPLIITPVSPAERAALGDQQHEVAASGLPVVVDDGQTRIVGTEVRFNRKTGSGSVIGKDHPILLEQPGRLRLTGGRLDFDRLKSSAEVTGAGDLYAQVETASLTGSPKPAPDPAAAQPPAPSTLEASWKRGMRLDFYRLPTEAKGGMGEIRQAAFHGQAEVKQQDGVLKGDDLLITFFPAQADRGQAVERLRGHGDVYLKNAQAPAPAADAAAKPKPTQAVGDIACQDLDLQFLRDAAGDTQPRRLDASGGVAINDPQGRIQAETLNVVFGKSDTGATEAQFLEAFGNVLIDRKDLHAEGDHVRRDLATGALLLEGKPGRARQGESRIVGPRIEFSEADGRATVRGAGELEMPATSDLRGRPRATPEPMLVQWSNGMLFEDKQNFAQFDGAVKARTGGSLLDCARLWIYFADRPAAPTQDPAAAAAPGAAAATAAPAKDASGAPGDMQVLFGRKSLIRVLAEKDVRAVEQQLDADKTLRYRMEISGENLTYLEENRKAYTRGPGRLRIMSRERAKAGETLPPGLAPDLVEPYWKGDAPAGYSRTDVGWTESMAYDGATDRAYFKGNVDAAYSGRGLPGGGAARARRSATTTRITSRDLQVVFGEKQAEPTATPVEPATPREERMAVEKLVADGNVQLWVDDRRGTSERLLYQREPEMIRLYRGPEDWARLWQENESTQEFGQVVARTITYDPSTGRIDVIDQQVITVGPKPKPVPPAKPRLVPGTAP